MSESKYVRVSDTLYEQHSKDGGKPTKWVKLPEPVQVELLDVEAVEVTNDTDLPFTFEGEPTDKPLEFRTTKRISATAKMDGSEIGIISEAGHLGARYTEMSVEVYPAQSEVVEKGRCGRLRHVSGKSLEYDLRRDPYLTLSLYVPPSTFDKAWEAISTGRAGQIHIRIYVPMFQRELDRALGDGWHENFYIEDGSSNPVTFSSLAITSPKVNRKPIVTNEDGTEPEPERSGAPLLIAVRRNLATTNQIAGYLKIIAGGVVAVAALLAIALLR